MFRSHHRYLLMTAAGLTAWQWREGQLIKEGTFDAGEIPAFDAYLRHHATQSFFMLVDIPDEAFRIDEIPHASRRDRKGIIRRRLERHFPGAPLTTAIPLERSRTGRRDDRFLFCALTRPLDPWMTALRRTESRLAGVFSMFQAMTSLAKQRGLLTSPCLMVLVSEAGLRQTFFKGGKPWLSRLTRLDAAKSLQNTLDEEAEKMRQYLIGQHLLVRDEPLTIDSSLNEQTLLMSLISNRPKQQFSSPDERRFYHAALTNVVLKCVGGFILAVCLWLGFKQVQPVPVLRDSMVEAKMQLQQREASLNSLPSPPLPWEHLRILMTQLETVQKSTIPPQTVLSTLAHALATFPEIDLVRFSWTVADVVPVIDFSVRLPTNLREQRLTLNALVSRISALPVVREIRIENRPFDGASDQLFRSDAERSDRFSLRIVLNP
ncbi:MAG: hypothetical protein Q8O31_00195 [Rhodocyclaceae bacterium]|nr:hypothetical protein [Rhodocyclaceae bacterium]